MCVSCCSVEEVESMMMEEKMLADMERMRVDGTLPLPSSEPQAVAPLRSGYVLSICSFLFINKTKTI